MNSEQTSREMAARASPIGRAIAALRLCASFYLGLGAPASSRRYPDCRVWAAEGYAPDVVHRLTSMYRGTADSAVERLNYRCARVDLEESGQQFFLKEFPWWHVLHDLERVVRCSRVHRAWRAGHLLPRLGILTPRPVGYALARAADGNPIEYLATEWLDDMTPFTSRLRAVEGVDSRRALLLEFARCLRHWNDCRVYLRDLMKNVAVRESGRGLEFYLTDLDQLHPVRPLSRPRIMRQMEQLAYWAGPLRQEEADTVVAAYLGARGGRLAGEIERVLLTTPPVRRGGARGGDGGKAL